MPSSRSLNVPCGIVKVTASRDRLGRSIRKLLSRKYIVPTRSRQSIVFMRTGGGPASHYRGATARALSADRWSIVACRLRILVFPETGHRWTARGLEHDLAADGSTLESAVDTLLKIVRAHIVYDRRHDHKPLSAFAPAPQLYWDAFTLATRLPITMELDWSETEARAQVVTAVASKHPAVH